MKFSATVLNTPWKLVGLVFALISIPESLKLDKDNYAFITSVRKLWWMSKKVRAAHIGQVVILSGEIKAHDLEHELVHVKQALREPFLHPFFLL